MSEAHTSSKLLKHYLSLTTHFEHDDFIKKLLNIIDNQNKELLFYKNMEININHNFSEFDEQDFKQQSVPLKIKSAYDMAHEISGAINTNNLYFITITFDPHRFDSLDLTSEESQKKYILKQIHNLRHRIGFVYGCFEKHKSGVIHSHLILETRDEETVKDSLIRAFSKNIKNRYCIDMSEVRDISNTLRYINTDIDRDGQVSSVKSKYGFYYFKNAEFYKNVF